MRVLIVDDNTLFLEQLAGFLAGNGVEVAGLATSGAEAVDNVSRLAPDVVLMDVAMPGMNGFEATRAIRARAGAPRVVMLTMHDDPEYRKAAAEAGAEGFVTKGDMVTRLLPLLVTP